MRRALVALVSLFVLTTAGVCDSTDTTSPEGVAGTYTLVSVNGQNLPATTQDGTITAGSLTINANNTFSFSETRTGQAAQVASGTWSVSGSTYTFHPTSAGDNEDATGTINGNTATITASEGVLVLVKQ